MKTNYVEHLTWYESSVKPYITTSHSDSTRCWHAAKHRPPRTLNDIRQLQQQRLQEQQLYEERTRTRKRLRLETDTEEEAVNESDERQSKRVDTSNYTSCIDCHNQNHSVSPFLMTMETDSPQSPPFMSDEEWDHDSIAQLFTEKDVEQLMTDDEDVRSTMSVEDDIINIETENLRISSQQPILRAQSEDTLYYDAGSDLQDINDNDNDNEMLRLIDTNNAMIDMNEQNTQKIENHALNDRREGSIVSMLSTAFHTDSLIPNQLEAISAALDGEDMLLVMPSGEPRRICYLLPATTNNQSHPVDGSESKMTIVIVPSTTDLIEHDNHFLRSYERLVYLFACKALRESKKNWISRDQLEQAVLSSNRPRPQLIFITHHDFFKSIHLFEELHSKHAIVRFVLEDAHCISQWGTEASQYFVFGYLRLADILRKTFCNIPITAVTAIPNERIHLDILHRLHIASNHCKIFKKSIFLSY